jgi:hypothetical protein
MATLQEVLTRIGGREQDEVEKAKDLNTALENYITEAGDAFVSIMRNKIDEENANSFSLLKQGLTFDPNVKAADGYSLRFESEEDYVNFRNEGVSGTENQRDTPYKFRTNRPNKEMALSIQEWMRNKGYATLDLSYAYAKATLIKKHGFDGIHFIEEAFSEQNLNLFNDGILTVLSNTVNNIFERVIPEFKT